MIGPLTGDNWEKQAPIHGTVSQYCSTINVYSLHTASNQLWNFANLHCCNLCFQSNAFKKNYISSLTSNY